MHRYRVVVEQSIGAIKLWRIVSIPYRGNVEDQVRSRSPDKEAASSSCVTPAYPVTPPARAKWKRSHSCGLSRRASLPSPCASGTRTLVGKASSISNSRNGRRSSTNSFGLMRFALSCIALVFAIFTMPLSFLAVLFGGSAAFIYFGWVLRV